MLVHEHEAILNRIKATHYNFNNKLGAYLAELAKTQVTKKKIAQVQHPSSKSILTNPNDIANAFAAYYQSLYDIKADPDTPQPNKKKH